MNHERIGMPKGMGRLALDIVKDYPNLEIGELFVTYLEVTAEYKTRNGDDAVIDQDVILKEAKKRIEENLANRLEWGETCLN